MKLSKIQKLFIKWTKISYIDKKDLLPFINNNLRNTGTTLYNKLLKNCQNYLKRFPTLSNKEKKVYQKKFMHSYSYSISYNYIKNCKNKNAFCITEDLIKSFPKKQLFLMNKKQLETAFREKAFNDQIIFYKLDQIMESSYYSGVYFKFPPVSSFNLNKKNN